MAKIPVCPYCGAEVVVSANMTSVCCKNCNSVCRVVSGKLYKSEEIPPEVTCCFVGLFSNIARSHEPALDNECREFVDDFLRKQNLTKKQYEYSQKIYRVESKRGFSFGGHESNKSYIARMRTVIDEICSSMPLAEQELYEDSVLKTIINFMLKGGGITADDEKIIQLYRESFGINDDRFKVIYNPSKKDEESKREKPKTIDEIFAEIQKKLLKKFSKQDFVSKVILAFKRPYMIKQQTPSPIKNIITVFTRESNFINDIVSDISYDLRKEKLSVTEPKVLDFILYKKEETLGSLVNSYMEAINAGTDIFVIQNFDVGSDSCKAFMRALLRYGVVEINTPKGVLQVKAKSEYYMFVSAKGVYEFEADISSEVFSTIKDVIQISDFTQDEIAQMIAISVTQFKKRCKRELEINLEHESSLELFLKEVYDSVLGINAIKKLLDCRIFAPVSDLKLVGKLNVSDLYILAVEGKDVILKSCDERIVLEDSDKFKSNAKLNAVKGKLNAVIGLDSVKDYLYKLEDSIVAQKMRERSGMKVAPLPLNMIFTGNPGTGKTTIARLVAEYLCALGVLEKGHLVEASRAELVGSVSGETAQITKSVVASAIGGVLFIDEAYALLNSKGDSHGKEALDTLVKMIEDNRENLVVILAGYKDEMEEMFSVQTGLKSRFPNVIHFEDYTAEQMYRIAENVAKQNQYKIAVECYEPLIDFFESRIFKGKNPNGNGRLVRNAVEVAISNQAVRIVKENELDYETLKLVDFELEQKAEFDLEGSLSKIIGLENVKQFLRNQYHILKAQEKRKAMGITADVTQSLNMIFLGNPGTGKTTVARVVAQMLRDMGFLRTGQLVEVSRAELVAEYVGQTAQKTTDVFNTALGGILFIDEAYSLSKGGDSDFGKEAIDTLIKLMEDHRGEIIVILAGYNKEMGDFLKANSGLESRFPLKLDFPDYSPEELLDIFDGMIASRGFKITDEARIAAAEKLAFMKKTAVTSFGNGRMVRNLIDEIVRNQSSRVALLEDIKAEDVNVIVEEDIGKKFETENSDYDYEKVFDSIIGLESVKQYIRMLAARIKIANERKKMGLLVAGEQSMHMIFKGNPGTGKTMMARAVADMLYKLGVISTNKLVETDRNGLVAGYVGQTAEKTTEKVKEAFNGVLFIDEAYALSQGGSNDFGKEAIDTLIKLMDDNRDKLVVILAGYSKEMTEFLDLNSGLLSRFPNVMEFEDYNTEQLMTIAKKLYSKNGYNLTEDALVKMEAIFEEARQDKRFGNGRYVRNMFERSINNQALRLSGSLVMDKDTLMNITADDITQ